jgi:CubicO group peptidase (beta-lactamase class C family)
MKRMTPHSNLKESLEAIRTKANLPALGVCTVQDGKIGETTVVGTRQLGGTEPVLSTDAFHIGSCTKAMTATLIGHLIEKKQLRFESTLGELFSFTPEPWKRVSVAHLLAQRSGFGPLIEPKGTDFNLLHGWQSTERPRWLKARLADAPDCPLGKTFIYSNANYMTLGLICEVVAKKPWETLIKDHVFTPLGMTTAGFGASPTLWQYQNRGGLLIPQSPKNKFDNPKIVAPAGNVHLTLADWARFAAHHASEATPTLKRLHTPDFGGDYAGGWIVVKERPWAGGDALYHNGTNTANYAVLWVAPKKRLAILAATNAFPEGVHRPIDEAIRAAIQSISG